MSETRWEEPFVRLDCPLCGTSFPVAANVTPQVERETRCQRCLVSALGRERLEVCLCAAIKLTDGRVIRGHRHDDCIQTAIKWQAEPVHAIQGFMTTFNRFVDRHDGMALQKASGIESVHGYRGDILFSEDLY